MRDALLGAQASMGPRSDNRGYSGAGATGNGGVSLQWVHGRITVVTVGYRPVRRSGPAASMGPRSDNRGYDPSPGSHFWELQASMGPRSDNRGYRVDRAVPVVGRQASMGPRSDNRGYHVGHVAAVSGFGGFNGSTVG